MDKDLEKNENPAGPPQYDYGSTAETKGGTRFSLFVDSFKRNPNARMVTELTDAEGKPLPNQPPAEPALAMKLKDRHLQMIAIGGSIGTKYLLHPKVLAFITKSILIAGPCRNWFIRRFWVRSCTGWSCVPRYRLRSHWNNAVLYSPCSG